MKITKKILEKLIKEELQKAVKEGGSFMGVDTGAGTAHAGDRIGQSVNLDAVWAVFEGHINSQDQGALAPNAFGEVMGALMSLTRAVQELKRAQ